MGSQGDSSNAQAGCDLATAVWAVGRPLHATHCSRLELCGVTTQVDAVPFRSVPASFFSWKRVERHQSRFDVLNRVSKGKYSDPRVLNDGTQYEHGMIYI